MIVAFADTAQVGSADAGRGRLLTPSPLRASCSNMHGRARVVAAYASPRRPGGIPRESPPRTCPRDIQLVEPHRLLAAAHLHAVDLTRTLRELAFDALVGVLADQDAGAVGLVQRLDARGEVHRVADHGVVEAGRRAHVADDHRPGVDADADADLGQSHGPPLLLQLVERAQHVERRAAGAAPDARLSATGAP